MEELANALFYDSIPDSWTRRAYPSLLSLGAWYADLLLRIRVSRPLVAVHAEGVGEYPQKTSSHLQQQTGLFFDINLSSLKYLKRPQEREQTFEK
ncbi:DYH17 protein, partial [Baryphthengus martii]|nr:DYH17 protein [Baryphthengus martii]